MRSRGLSPAFPDAVNSLVALGSGRSTSEENVLVIGKLGRVTGRIGPGLVGEIMVAVRGGVEAFYAHPQQPDDEIEPGVQVVIVDFHPPRTAYVERWNTI